MAKVGEGTRYYVGHVPPVEKSNTLMSRDDIYQESVNNVFIKSEENSENLYTSPSNDSKKVRFVGSTDDDNDISNHSPDSRLKNISKNGTPNGDVRSFKSVTSYNTYPQGKSYTPTKNAPIIYYDTPSPTKSLNYTTSPTKSMTSSKNSARFKFHASDDVTPDLVLPEKRNEPKTNSRTVSVTSNLYDSENFKYHASSDVEMASNCKTSRNTQSKDDYKDVFYTENMSTDEKGKYSNEELNTTRKGRNSTSSKDYEVEEIKDNNKTTFAINQVPKNVKLDQKANAGSESGRNSGLTDDNNSRRQSRQSESTTLPPAKQNGTLVTGNDVNNNNGNRGETRITNAQNGYFRNKKISSPPMKKNTKPRTGSAPSQNQKESIEDTPRLRINNLIGFDKNEQNSQYQSMDEDTNTRNTKKRDTQSFSNSYLKAKTDNPSNYATNESKTEVSESVVKSEKSKGEIQKKNSTSSHNSEHSKSQAVKSPDSVKDTKTVDSSNSQNKGNPSEGDILQPQEEEKVKADNSASLVKNNNSKKQIPSTKSDKSKNLATVTKSPESSENEKSEKESKGFHYHAKAITDTHRDKSSTENKENDVPPLDLSHKPKTKNGVFRFTINTNKSQNRYKRWSSKSDPTSNTSPQKERPKSLLANQQEVRPITKSRQRTFRMDEKEKSIYRNRTFLWDEDTTEAFHTPAVNRAKGITKTYTGETNHREALKSARGSHRPKSSKTPFVYRRRSKIPPWYEKAKVLSRQQVNIFQNIKSTYGQDNDHHKRESQFLEKIQKCQIEQSRQEYEEMMETEKKKREAKRLQARQLKELRKRFEDEAWHRFQTQYVTSRILEHEKVNRYEYGLPEDPSGEPEFASKLKRKKKVPTETVTADKLKKINKKKYGQMFNMKMGPINRPKTPLMEGIDTVVITQTDETGNAKEKKKMVKKVITEAQDQVLQVPEKGSGLTPREDSDNEKEVSRKTPSLNFDEDDDDDDDMSDIFEHARRKYHLDIDED